MATKNPYAAKHVAQRLLSEVEKLKIVPVIGLSVKRLPVPEKIRDLF